MFGENNPKATLIWEKVKQIRTEVISFDNTIVNVSKKYNINDVQAGRIINNKSWVDKNYIPPDKKILKNNAIIPLLKRTEQQRVLLHTDPEQVKRFLADGLTYKIIAKKLNVSIRSVAIFIKNNNLGKFVLKDKKRIFTEASLKSLRDSQRKNMKKVERVDPKTR